MHKPLLGSLFLLGLLCIAGVAAADSGITISADKTALDNGGTITVTGQAPAGTPIYLEVWSDQKVRSSFFDAKPGPDGRIPYKLFMTHSLPAYYRLYLPEDKADVVEKYKKAGNSWSYSDALKETGAGGAYSVPAKADIDAYQASIMASIIGSRGELQPKLDEKEGRRRSMQLTKARFRSVGKLLSPTVAVKPDGSFSAQIAVPQSSAPGRYNIVAVSGDGRLRSEPARVENAIAFPSIYLPGAGMSINMFTPFFLSLLVTIFGVLIGAGGGFILNPLLIAIFGLPHTIVAGTVMPTVLFSQASGVINYSKIKFINWKLGISMGVAMLAGGFLGPKLTELVTLDQYKFVFGWILLLLAALMFWQTTPGYLAKNKKEQAILKEFKARAMKEAQSAQTAKEGA